MSPQQVFAMLNRIFSSFDELAEKFGVEKIKTIGDAYMVPPCCWMKLWAIVRPRPLPFSRPETSG